MEFWVPWRGRGGLPECTGFGFHTRNLSTAAVSAWCLLISINPDPKLSTTRVSMNTAVMTEGHPSFTIPKRAILTKEDLDRFHNSEAYDKVLGFILRLNDSVRGQTLKTETTKSLV